VGIFISVADIYISAVVTYSVHIVINRDTHQIWH